MLTVAESYFESDDFRGDVILHVAFPHPLLKCLIRFERGPDSLMRTDDRADRTVPTLSTGRKIQAFLQRERRRRSNAFLFLAYIGGGLLSALQRRRHET
jgi:hypothetical protein